MAMVRELQPDILINDRLDIPGDFVTPEQYQPDGPMQRDGAAGAVGGLPDAQRQLGLRPRQPGLEVAGAAGADAGRLGLQGRQPAAERRPDRARRVRPAGAGHAGRRSASGCGCTSARSAAPGRAEYAAPPDCRYTQKGNRLYLHLFAWPMGHVHLPGLAGKVKYAQLLNDASEIKRIVNDPHQTGPEHHHGRRLRRHPHPQTPDPEAERPGPGDRAVPLDDPVRGWRAVRPGSPSPDGPLVCCQEAGVGRPGCSPPRASR